MLALTNQDFLQREEPLKTLRDTIAKEHYKSLKKIRRQFWVQINQISIFRMYIYFRITIIGINYTKVAF